MTAGRTTTLTDRIEQRLALGDIPEDIALRLGVRLAEVLRVGEAMDQAAKHVDRPDVEMSYRRCPQQHLLSPDNVLKRSDNRKECRVCKEARDKQYQRRMRQQRKAS